jgi:hypothetical protein
LRLALLILPMTGESVERSMHHEDRVVERALALIGQQVNPVAVVNRAAIREIYSRIPGAGTPPPGLNGFRVAGDPALYINRDSDVYAAAAQDGSPFAILRLAAVIVHEQGHDGGSELDACRAQLDLVRRLASTVPQRESTRLQQYRDALEARTFLLSIADERQRR